MCLKNVLAVSLLLGIAVANVVVNDDSWLDKVLEKNKDKVEKYVKKDNPVDIQAVILPKPDGFKDPKNWTLDSVLALVKLIKESKSSEAVLQAMRRAIKNSETKFRGSDADQPNTIIRIKDHLQAELPHSEIRMISVMDFLLHSDPNDPDDYHGPFITPAIPPVDVKEHVHSVHDSSSTDDESIHIKLNLHKVLPEDKHGGGGNGGGKDPWIVIDK